MSRPLRLEFAGALYHLTARGDGRKPIYRNDTDRNAWLDVLGQTCQRFNWNCYAYCLMSNHYHLLIETPTGNLSAGMRQLGGVYTQRFNRQHRRVGHVFQGRYKAILVDRDNYLLEVARYIVLNPVRARIVDEPSAWPWSSYNAMLGLEIGGSRIAPEWLQARSLLALFAQRLGVARKRYTDFVRAGVGLPSPWQALRGQIYLGDDAFLQRMQTLGEAQGSLAEIPRTQRRPLALPLEDYLLPSMTRDTRNTQILAA